MPLTQGHWRYLMVLRALCGEDGGARITDVSAALHVSKPSAHRMVLRLTQMELAEAAPRGRVYLTARGRKLADLCQSRLGGVRELLQNELKMGEEEAGRAALALLEYLPEGTGTSP